MRRTSSFVSACNSIRSSRSRSAGRSTRQSPVRSSRSGSMCSRKLAPDAEGRRSRPLTPEVVEDEPYKVPASGRSCCRSRASSAARSSFRSKHRESKSGMDDMSDDDDELRNSKTLPSSELPTSQEVKDRRTLAHQENRSQKQLLNLLKENETLRASVVALRGDFETILRHMKLIEESNNNGSGLNVSLNTSSSSSIVSDNSRISHCLRKINEVKSLVMDKIDENRDQLCTRDRKLKSHQRCIDDLLSENERLYDTIVTMSRERENVIHEVCQLRRSSGDIAAKLSNEEEESEETARGATSTVQQDTKTTDYLIDDISKLTDDFAKQDDIMSLVSKILMQRKKSTASTVMPQKKKDFSESEVLNDISKATVGMSKQDDIMDLVSSILSKKSDDPVLSSSKVSAPRQDDAQHDATINARSSNVATKAHDSPGKSSRRHDFGQSNRTVFLEDDDDDDDDSSGGDVDQDQFIITNNEHDVSSNSLFYGGSSIVSSHRHRHEDDEDDTSTLEIVYEYNDDGECCKSYQESRSSRRRKCPPSHRRPSDKTCSSSEESLGTLVDRYQRSKHSFHSNYSHAQSSKNSSKNSDGNSNASPVLEKAMKLLNMVPAADKVVDSLSTRGASEKSSCGSKSQQAGECTRQPDSVVHERYEDDQEMADAIDSHIDKSTLLGKPHRSDAPSIADTSVPASVDTPSIAATSVAESASTVPQSIPSEPSCDSSVGSCNSSVQSSVGSGSTREAKGICLTVVSRSSPLISFPSSVAHTYVTFFHANLTKDRVDDVLEEQFRQEKLLEAKLKELGGKKKKYQGEYNDLGERHGYGIYTSKNGNEYRGEWQHDKREGLGVVKIGNGDVFEGQFEGNLKNGIGVYHYKDGECDLSLYAHDQRIGDCVRYSRDRKRAFLLGNGGSKGISLEEASTVAKNMGTIVAF